MANSVFGEFDPLTETDGLFVQLMNFLHTDARFGAAVEAGELSDEAMVAIGEAFQTVFDRNQRLANIFLADKEAREAVMRFWFARSYAEVQANEAYRKAFKSAQTAVPAWECKGCGQWGTGNHVCPSPKQKRVARGRTKREPEASNGKPDLAGHRDSSSALPVADLHN